MDSEKTLLDWLQGPLLIIILITPLRFALEAAGVSPHVTTFFSSTAFVFLLSAYLGFIMAGRIKKAPRHLLATGFALGYMNGLMTLIATVLSTYTSIETHYRHLSLNMTKARHILVEHVIENPLLISLGAFLIVSISFLISGKIKQLRKTSHTLSGNA